jgi:hypothetical protein
MTKDPGRTSLTRDQTEKGKNRFERIVLLKEEIERQIERKTKGRIEGKTGRAIKGKIVLRKGRRDVTEVLQRGNCLTIHHPPGRGTRTDASLAIRKGTIGAGLAKFYL